MDAAQYGDIESEISVEREIVAPAQEIREYRYRFNRKRRELIRDALLELIDTVDGCLMKLRPWRDKVEAEEPVTSPHWSELQASIDQIEVLLGSSVSRPSRWPMLRRHLHFALACDFDDILQTDWPSVKGALKQGLYSENEPLPVAVQDLSELAATRPRGPVLMKLDWTTLDAEGFERLVFALISRVTQSGLIA